MVAGYVDDYGDLFPQAEPVEMEGLIANYIRCLQARRGSEIIEVCR
jgi:hypothetical protein